MWLLAIGPPLCTALAFPPCGLWWLTFVALTGWVVLAALPTLTRTAWVAVTMSSLAMWLWFQLWVIDVAVVGYPFMCLYLALYAPLFLWIARRVAGGSVGRRLPWAVLTPLVAVTVEWVRGVVVFNGYPWYSIGQPLIDCPPLAQIADFGGTPAASFLVASVSGGVVDAVRGRRVGMVFATCALAASLGYGLFRQHESQTYLSSGPRILAVQTNITTDNKLGWPRERQESDVAEFARMTFSLAHEARERGEAIDLVVWPETMLPGMGLEPETIALMTAGGWWPGDRFATIAQLIAQRVDAPFLVGSPAYIGLRAENERWAWDQQFNSAYVLDPRGPSQRYDKIFLTPFGETMPYISNWTWLETKLLALGARGMTFDLDASTEVRRLSFTWRDAPEGQQLIEFATPICFEDTVAPLVRQLVYDHEHVKRAQLIVNLSNDGWFGFSDAGRAQHALIARWRCIENRVPMVRVANTGISQGFTSMGAPIEGALCPARTAGGFTLCAQLDSRETLFGRWGDVGSPLMSFVTLFLLVRWNRCSARVANSSASAMAVLLGTSIALLFPGCTPSQTSPSAAATTSWSSRPPKVDPSMSIREPAPIDVTVEIAPTEIAPTEITPTEVVVVEEVAIENTPEALPPARTESASIAMRAGKTPAQLALDILVAASSSQEAIYRAHALEGLQPCPAELEPAAFRLLADENPGVRFAAAVTVGRNRFAQCAQVVEPLTLDPNLSVRAAALYALVRLGRVVDLTPLAQLMMSEDADVRSNAFFVLGELRNPSAIPLVESAVGRPLIGADRTRARIVDLQGAEAMAKMGDYRQFDPIRAALFAPSDQSEIVALACQMVGEIDDRGARGHLIGLWNGRDQLQKPLEVRLIVGTALVRIGEPNLEPILQLCVTSIKDPSPSVRAQTAATLGWVGGPQAIALLSGAMADPVPIVRLTAAAGYMRATTKSGGNGG